MVNEDKMIWKCLEADRVYNGLEILNIEFTLCRKGQYIQNPKGFACVT